MPEKIRVLVIDDSAMVRKVITDTLHQDPDIEVVGTAQDPLFAIEKIPKLRPDVLTLDMEMPRMDGLTFLRKLKAEKSTIPVVVVSALTQQGSQMALDAMEAGACDILAKPDGSYSIGALAGRLAFHVKAAARSRRQPQLTPVKTAPASGSVRPMAIASGGLDLRLILMGASTGGVEALRYLLPSLPAGLPPIVVVQHIPAHFSKAMAERINQLCDYEVREAVDNEPLQPGVCLFAPGDFHLLIVKRFGGYSTRLTQSPPIQYSRPSVDVLFRSGADAAGAHALGILLTGMGSDGAIGMQAIKRAGGRTLAEHEDSCVVYGMPRAAAKLGVVDQAVRLGQMPDAIIKALDSVPR